MVAEDQYVGHGGIIVTRTMTKARRLRVVHLVHLLGWAGGGERFAARLVAALDPSGSTATCA